MKNVRSVKEIIYIGLASVALDTATAAASYVRHDYGIEPEVVE